MAKSLEEMIRDADKRGVLTHLSIVSVAGGFSASFASVHGHAIERHKDPVEALKAALNAAPKGKARVTKPTDPRTEDAPAADSMDFG